MHSSKILAYPPLICNLIARFEAIYFLLLLNKDNILWLDLFFNNFSKSKTIQLRHVI